MGACKTLAVTIASSCSMFCGGAVLACERVCIAIAEVPCGLVGGWKVCPVVG